MRTAVKALETVELEYQYSNDAMVSCTPYWDDTVMLPTVEVPYADYMVWEWEIARRTKINKVVVVAKATHQFSIHNDHLRRGDTLVFYLYAKDLAHGH